MIIIYNSAEYNYIYISFSINLYMVCNDTSLRFIVFSEHSYIAMTLLLGYW